MDNGNDIRQELERATATKNDSASADKKLNSKAISAQRELIEIKGRESFFKLRSNWSWVIIIWISLLIIFNIVLTVLVGSGCLHFTDDKWFLRLVVGETFLQIVGMGYVAVRFLFSSGY